MNTINSIFSRHNLNIIEVIINIRAASRAINFRTRSLRAQTCHELGSVPSLIISFIRDEAPEVPTSSFNFLPEDSNKNARRLRRQTRRTRGWPDARQVLVFQSFNQHPERNPFVRTTKTMKRVEDALSRLVRCVHDRMAHIEKSVKNT